MLNEYDGNTMVAGALTIPTDQAIGIAAIRKTELSEHVDGDPGKTATDKSGRVAAESPRDTANLSFALSQDERTAIKKAMDGDGAGLSEKEREAMEEAAKRITRAIDETIAKYKDRGDRVNKAVGDWYSLLMNGEGRNVGELIRILREAAVVDNFNHPTPFP